MVPISLGDLPILRIFFFIVFRVVFRLQLPSFEFFHFLCNFTVSEADLIKNRKLMTIEIRI